jgi:hypothetical protein
LCSCSSNSAQLALFSFPAFSLRIALHLAILNLPKSVYLFWQIAFVQDCNCIVSEVVCFLATIVMH